MVILKHSAKKDYMLKHNYQKKLFRMLGEIKLEPKAKYHTIIKHSGWCGIFKGKRCNCDPVIEIVPETERRN